MCSPEGRGYPDIAAEAEDILYVVDGEVSVGDGTSFAVSVCLSHTLLHLPCVCLFSITQLTVNVQTVAGIVSLLNDFRVSQHYPPLGFLNYLLYGEGSEGLNDITEGSNPGCGTDGFPAKHGWDPVRSTRLITSSSMSTNFVLLRSRV